MNTDPNAGGYENLNVSYPFTRQEFKVLERSRQLMTNKEIANLLSIEEVTVKTHRKNIMKKVGISGKIAMNRFIMTLKFN